MRKFTVFRKTMGASAGSLLEEREKVLTDLVLQLLFMEMSEGI